RGGRRQQRRAPFGHRLGRLRRRRGLRGCRAGAVGRRRGGGDAAGASRVTRPASAGSLRPVGSSRLGSEGPSPTGLALTGPSPTGPALTGPNRRHAGQSAGRAPVIVDTDTGPQHGGPEHRPKEAAVDSAATSDNGAITLDLSVDRDSATPLYLQLAGGIEEAMRAGTLPPGSRLENELALSKRLGLSRPTVRQGIQELVDKGMLVRKRGVGTQVVQAPVNRQVALTSLYDDLRTAGKSPRTEI